jgi:hypothetical protein
MRALWWAVIAAYVGLLGYLATQRLGTAYWLILPVMIVVGAVTWYAVRDAGPTNVPKWLAVALPVLALLLALGIRLGMLVHAGAPLGYDSGLHKFIFEHPFSEEWAKWMDPWPFLLVMSTLARVIPADALVTWVFAVIDAGLGVALWLVVRRLYGNGPAVITTLLFAASVPQYLTFSDNLYKSVLGMILLVASLPLLEHPERIWPITAMGIAIACMHDMSFFVFFCACALLLLADVKQWRSSAWWMRVLSLGLMLAGLVAANADRIMAVFSYHLNALLTNTPTLSTLGGQFMDLPSFGVVSFVLAPFALAGIALNWKRAKPLCAMAFVVGVMVFGGLLMHDRYISYLDLFLLPFAALGLMAVVSKMGKPGVVVVAVILLLAFAPITKHLALPQPALAHEEFASLADIAPATEQNATILVMYHQYASFVKGWVPRQIVTPLFDRSITLDDYGLFLSTLGTPSFVQRLPRPLYIFVGWREPQVFDGKPCFKRVPPDTMQLYRYLC